MRGTLTRMPRRQKTRAHAGFAVLAMALSFLGGCAAGGKVQVPAAKVEAPAAKVEAPPAKVEAPPAKVEAPPAKVEAPPAKVEAPAAKVEAPAAPQAAAVKGPQVAALADGREGFTITEVPAMDEASRADFDRAVAFLRGQDYGRAIDLLEKVIERSPGVTAPYIDIAIAYQRVGKPELAEKHLQTALTLFPGHPAACNEYGLLYRRTGRFAEARAMYEKAIERFPLYYPAHKNLGILCDVYLNDPACALEHYEIYSKVKPDDAQAALWIPGVRARLGRK
ncbi:MAG TPA: tetratricopeptide repeat protein [Candidatus Deferrimicrobiaceae bacterium]